MADRKRKLLTDVALEKDRVTLTTDKRSNLERLFVFFLLMHTRARARADLMPREWRPNGRLEI